MLQFLQCFFFLYFFAMFISNTKMGFEIDKSKLWKLVALPIMLASVLGSNVFTFSLGIYEIRERKGLQILEAL